MIAQLNFDGLRGFLENENTERSYEWKKMKMKIFRFQFTAIVRLTQKRRFFLAGSPCERFKILKFFFEN